MSIKQTLQELSKILDTSYDNLADKVFRRVLEMREESPEEKQRIYDSIRIAQRLQGDVIKGILPIADKLDKNDPIGMAVSKTKCNTSSGIGMMDCFMVDGR